MITRILILFYLVSFCAFAQFEEPTDKQKEAYKKFQKDILDLQLPLDDEVTKRNDYYKKRLDEYLKDIKKTGNHSETSKNIKNRDWIEAQKDFDNCWSRYVSNSYMGGIDKTWSFMQKCFEFIEGRKIRDENFSQQLLEQKLKQENEKYYVAEVIKKENIKQLEIAPKKIEGDYKYILPGMGEVLTFETEIQDILVKYVDDKSLKGLVDNQEEEVLEQLAKLIDYRDSFKSFTEGKADLCSNYQDIPEAGRFLNLLDITDEKYQKFIPVTQVIFAGELKDLTKAYFEDEEGQYYIFSEDVTGRENYLMLHYDQNKHLSTYRFKLSRLEDTLAVDEIRKNGSLATHFGKDEKVKGGVSFDYGLKVRKDAIETWNEHAIAYPVGLDIQSLRLFVPIKDLRWQLKDNITLGTDDSRVSSILYSSKNHTWQIENEARIGLDGVLRVDNRLRMYNLIIGHNYSRQKHGVTVGYFKNGNYLQAYVNKDSYGATAGRFWKKYPGGVEYVYQKLKDTPDDLIVPSHKLKLIILLDRK